jgi:hypothetical protein
MSLWDCASQRSARALAHGDHIADEQDDIRVHVRPVGCAAMSETRFSINRDPARARPVASFHRARSALRSWEMSRALTLAPALHSVCTRIKYLARIDRRKRPICVRQAKWRVRLWDPGVRRRTRGPLASVGN